MKRELKINKNGSSSKVKALLQSIDEHVDELNNSTADIMKAFEVLRGMNLTDEDRNELTSIVEESINNTKGKL